MRRCSVLVCTTLALAQPAIAHAHAALVDPPPRSGNTGLTEGPCGGVAPTGTITALPAGGTVELRWIVDVSHDNAFRIAFAAADDAGFDDAVLATTPDLGEAGEHTLSVALPACTCDACTLQLLQWTASGNGGYYSCADVRLVGADLPPCEAASGGSSSSGGEGTSSTGAGTHDGDGSSDGVATDTGATGSDAPHGSSGDDTDEPTTTATATTAAQTPDAARGCNAARHRPAPWLLLLLACGLRRSRRRHCCRDAA